MNYFDFYKKDNLKRVFVEGHNDLDYCERVFEALYDFYKAFYCSKEYSIKIMITRRSYVLFKIFSRCFENFDPIEKYGDFYTNNYISMFSKKMIEDNSILIIDDIIINGRTAGTVYKQLINIYNKNVSCIDNAYISAFLLNREGRCLEQIETFLVADDRIATTNEFGWREISDLLNAFIARVNIGYVSYIDSYQLWDSYKLPNFGLSKIFSQSNLLFLNNDVKSYICFPNKDDFIENKDFFELLKKLNIVPCYRFYQRHNSWTFIPFAFLPPIKKDDFIDYFCCIIENISDKEGKLNRIKGIVKDCNSSKEYVFWYEWITFVLSKCLANVLFQDCMTNKAEHPIISLDCYENYKDFYISSISLKKKVIQPSKSYTYSKNDIISSEERECISIFKNLYDKNINNVFDNSLFSHYLFITRNADQKRALSQKDRLRGIRVDDVKNLTNSSIESIIKIFINCWDCGEGSGSPKLFGVNDDFICTSIINGEQIYRYPFDIDEQVTCDYKILYDNTLLPTKMIVNMFSDFADYMLAKTRNTDYKVFADIFNAENYEEFDNSINSDNIVNDENVSYMNFSLILRFIKEYISNNF